MTSSVDSKTPTARPSDDRPARLLALGGVIGPVLFTSVWIVAGAIRPGYSHVGQFISDLGATGSPHAALMNYAGFVPGGLMFTAFGIALGIFRPRTRAALVGGLFVTLFGLGVTASGAISCDPGCPQDGGTFENLVHNRIGPLSFLSFIVGIAILGVRFRGLSAWRGLAIYSLATSGVALVLLIALAGSLETRALTGLWQRLLLTCFFVWSMIVGWRVFEGENERAAGR